MRKARLDVVRREGQRERDNKMDIAAFAGIDAPSQQLDIPYVFRGNAQLASGGATQEALRVGTRRPRIERHRDIGNLKHARSFSL